MPGPLKNTISVALDNETYFWLGQLEEPYSVFIRKLILAYRKRIELLNKSEFIEGKFLILLLEGEILHD